MRARPGRALRLLGLIAVLTLGGGVGCASSDPVLQVDDPTAFEPGVAFSIRPFTAEAAKQKILAGEARYDSSLIALGLQVSQRIRRELEASLQQAEVVPADAKVDSGLVIEGEVLEVDEGNRVLRQFLGFGAGETILHVTGRVTRATDGKVVASFDIRRVGQFGLFGGRARELIQADIRGHGRDIAYWLARLSSESSP